MRLTRPILLSLIIILLLAVVNIATYYTVKNIITQRGSNIETREYQLRGLRNKLDRITKDTESFDNVITNFEALEEKVTQPQPELRNPAKRIELLRRTLRKLSGKYYLRDISIRLNNQKRFETQHEDMFYFIDIEIEAKTATDGLFMGFVHEIYSTLPGDVRITNVSIAKGQGATQPMPASLHFTWHVPKWRKELY